MNKYKYKMSIIVPIYNVENYLHFCIKSILNQTMDYNDMEVLLLDDGSSDNSLAICQQYCAMYPMFKVITKENEGVSKTRNLGLNLSQGKYILYLDGDDGISKDTLENIYNFFEAYEKEIDLVTYPIRKYSDGKGFIGTMHYRYKYLNKTGIYTLDKNPYIIQTTMNICVKNTTNKIYFDENLFVHEDQDYITRLVMEKGKIGFVQEALYYYVQREDSVMKNVSAIELWDPTISQYEKLFSKYEVVPKYVQSLFFNDIKWKLVSDILYPSHLEPTAYAKQIARMEKLLEAVEVDVIYDHPDTDVFHKFYWLYMKPNNNLTFYNDSEKVALFSGSNELYHKKNIEFITHRILHFDNNTYLLFCVKSPVFAFGAQVNVFAYEYKNDEYTKKKMMLFDSAANYYKARVKTNKFFSFYYECPVTGVEYTEFKVEINGLEYPVSYYIMPQCQMDLKNGLCKYKTSMLTIGFSENKKWNFYANSNEEVLSKQKRLEMSKHNEDVYQIKRSALEMKKSAPIWLYYDCNGVLRDNGYYQFMHDVKKEDGIKRYYVHNHCADIVDELFAESITDKLITFGSFFHKILYLNADKVITAFIEEPNYNPFLPTETALLKDMLHAQIIYLQHGILHAHLPWKYSPEKINIDKIVVSSEYEVNNFINTYGFHEKMLLKTGMSRFDYFDYGHKPIKKKILFAPTWRKYLIGEGPNGTWIPQDKEFVESKFYKECIEFINSEKLCEILEKNDIELDVKLHPIFKPYMHLLHTECEKIQFLQDSNNDDEYSAFITDFSSYVFDFAYRKLNILYFVPDIDEFKVGLNGYRKLDLPFENAFGRICYDAKMAVEEVTAIIERKFTVEPLYLNRMDKFFFEMNNCCEQIYLNLVEEK